MQNMNSHIVLGKRKKKKQGIKQKDGEVISTLPFKPLKIPLLQRR